MKKKISFLILMAAVFSLYCIPVFADTDDTEALEVEEIAGDTEAEEAEIEDNSAEQVEDKVLPVDTETPGVLDSSSGNGFLSIKCYVEDGLIGNAVITLMDIESLDETDIDLYYADYFAKTVPLKPGRYKVITGGFINDHTHRYPFSILNSEYVDISSGVTTLFECAIGNTEENPLGTEISEKVILPNGMTEDTEPVGTALDEAYKAGLIEIEEEKSFPFGKVFGIALFITLMSALMSAPFIYIFFSNRKDGTNDNDDFLF